MDCDMTEVSNLCARIIELSSVGLYTFAANSFQMKWLRVGVGVPDLL